MTEPTPKTESTESKEAPKKGRRWGRRLLVLALVLLVLVVLAPLALALPFVKNMVADKASDALGRPVSIESAFAFWGKGIDLDGIRVESPEGFDEPLATVKHVHVDLDLLALLGGGVDADVEIVEPRVSLLTNADGATNHEGLLAREEGEAADDSGETPPSDESTAGDGSSSNLDLRLHVEDGVVRATPAPGARVEEVRDLDVVMELTSDGTTGLKLAATAVDAAAGGGNATIALDARLSGAGEGPVSVKVPSLDLARLASLFETAGGLKGVRGRLSLDVDAALKAERGLVGKVDARLDGLAFAKPGEMKLEAQRISAMLDAAEGADDDRNELLLKIENLRLQQTTEGETRVFEEPLIEASLKGRFDKEAKLLNVESGKLSVGTALTATVSEPWQIELGDEPKVKGQLVVRTDLSRLANLRGLVPQLELVPAGLVAASIAADTQERIEIKAALRAVHLQLAPEKLAHGTFKEPEITVHANLARDKGEGDLPWTLVLRSVKSSLLTVSPAQGAEPLTLWFGEDGLQDIKGGLYAQADLARVGQAFGGAMGLEPTDRVRGTLRLRVDGSEKDGDIVLGMRLIGEQISLPASWIKGVPAETIDGQAWITMSDDETKLDLTQFKGFGLDAKALVLTKSGEAGGLQDAKVKITGDLARAQGLLTPLLGLQGKGRMAGALDLETGVVAQGADKHLKGSLVIKNLDWTDANGQVVLREPSLEVPHDLALLEEGKRFRFDDLRILSQVLQVGVEGSAVTRKANGRNTESTTELDARLKLSGDAAKLAGVLKVVLGEDYSDLKGSGAIQGHANLKGSTANGGERLLVDAEIRPGTWETGGLTLSSATLTVKRARTEEPMRLTFDAGVNGGTLDLDSELKPSAGAMPWSVDLKLANVDTAPLLVDHGLGEYLTYLLPTLVPSDATTPALSGRLDTEVRVGGDDIEAPTLESSLQGLGFVRMSQGTIGNSSLFSAMGGGKGLGDVGRVLATAVPEVGQSLTSLQRSLTFTTVESHFTIANRVVTVTKGLLEGERTRIDFTGTVGFSEKVDLDMDLTLGGKAGERLAKVMPAKNSTIPLDVTGTMSSPTVTPRLNASSLTAGALEGLLPIPGRGDGGNDNPVDRIRDLFPR